MCRLWMKRFCLVLICLRGREIFAPAGTPKEIVNTLAREVEKITSMPALKEQFTTLGIDVFWAGPEELQNYVKTDLEKWTGMIKESGIEPKQ